MNDATVNIEVRITTGGRLAYEAYCNSEGMFVLMRGQPFSPWSELPQTLKDAWESAASAVRDDFVNSMTKAMSAMKS